MDSFSRVAALPTVQSMHVYAAHLEQSLRVVALLQVVQLLAYEVAAQHRRSIVEVEEGCCSNKNKHRIHIKRVLLIVCTSLGDFTRVGFVEVQPAVLV